MKIIFRLTYYVWMLCLLFTSCRSDKDYPEAMQKAIACMESHPDSAQIYLASLDSVIAHEPEETRMYHALLTTQANDKLYITHTSDSVMQQVVRFYDTYGDADKRMLSYLYLGSVYRDLQDAPRALHAYQLAAEAGQGSTHYQVLARIHYQIGLLFAYLLNKKTPGRTAFRALIFYPNISPMVGFYLVWMYLLASDIGYVNRIFALLGLPARNWLGDSKTVLFSIALIYIWRQAGYMMLFYLSGLQGIDASYYEAATLDGANEWQKFRFITFPLLMPTSVFTVMLSISTAVQVVDPIAILTGGGPNNASSMLMYYIYKQAFSNFDYGMAATYSVILMVVLLIVICIQNFSMDRLTHYES